MAKKTQAQCAIEAIANEDLTQLRHVVDEAQNRPPLGLNDGSIDEPVWYALRDLVRAWDVCDAAAHKVFDFMQAGRLR